MSSLEWCSAGVLGSPRLWPPEPGWGPASPAAPHQLPAPGPGPGTRPSPAARGRPSLSSVSCPALARLARRGKDRGRNYSFVTGAQCSVPAPSLCSPRGQLFSAGWPPWPLSGSQPLSPLTVSAGTRPGVTDLAALAWPGPGPPSPLMSKSEEMRK